MAFNLIDLVQDQISGQLVKQASGMLGESESGITKALGGVFPAVLGSLINKGTDESTADSMFDLVKSVDPGILGNIGGALGGATDDKPDSIMNLGTGLLSSLMGDKLGGAVDLVSKLGGIKSGSAMSLFKMATPFLMGLISKKVASDGMGLSGFMSLLTDQKDSVSKMLPAGMGSLMGLSGLMGSAKDTLKRTASTTTLAVTEAATTVGSKTSSVTAGTADATKRSANGLFKWLIPALLALGAIYFLTQSKMCKETAVGDAMEATLEKGTELTGDAVGATADLASDAMEATGELATDAGEAVVGGAQVIGDGVSAVFGNVNEAAKTALSKISFAAGSVGTQMMDFISGGTTGSPTFSFTNLNFESRSANFSGETGEEVDNLASILKAYPDVKVRIDAHTDSDGDEIANRKLATDRANAVKARLEAGGIAADRIYAEGLRESSPIADNATAEGKAKNRRIEVTIVK